MADMAVLRNTPLSLLEMFYLLDFICHASLRLHRVFSGDLNFLWSYYKHSLPRDWVRLAHAMWPAVSVTLYCDTCRPFVPACSQKAATMSDPWWMTNVIYPVVRINCHTADSNNVEHCSE